MIIFKKKQVICVRMGSSTPLCQEEFGMLCAGGDWAALLRATTKPTRAAGSLLSVQEKDMCSRSEERNYSSSPKTCKT